MAPGWLSGPENVEPPPSTSGPSEPPDVPDPVAPWTDVTWSAVPAPFAPGDPRPLRLDGLASDERILVGWGRIEARGRNQFNDMGAVFVSNNGEQWRSIALDDGVGAEDTSEPSGIAIGPRGLLAYGGVCCTVEERAMWESQDGLTWVRVRIGGDLDPRRSWPARIIGTAEGWIAVGQEGKRAAIWTSPDGHEWKRAGPVEGDLGIGLLSDVAPYGQGFIAVGTIDDAAATHDGAIWLSDHGTTWTRSGSATRV